MNMGWRGAAWLAGPCMLPSGVVAGSSGRFPPVYRLHHLLPAASGPSRSRPRASARNRNNAALSVRGRARLERVAREVPVVAQDLVEGIEADAPSAETLAPSPWSGVMPTRLAISRWKEIPKLMFMEHAPVDDAHHLVHARGLTRGRRPRAGRAPGRRGVDEAMIACVRRARESPRARRLGPCEGMTVHPACGG